MGNWRKATQPTRRTPTIRRVVATGRRINGRDGLIAEILRPDPSTAFRIAKHPGQETAKRRH